MTNHKATPEQWEQCKEWLNNPVVGATDSCVFELLSRVESLEEDTYEENKSNHACFEALVKRVEKLEANSKATPNYVQIRSSLVRKVQRAIDKEYEESLGTGENEAKAAILAVADWLWGELWPEAAEELEQQVNQ
jgi:hypothetical protein